MKHQRCAFCGSEIAAFNVCEELAAHNDDAGEELVAELLRRYPAGSEVSWVVSFAERGWL